MFPCRGERNRMTTFFMCANKIRSLDNLREMCLLDEKPGAEMIVYDEVDLRRVRTDGTAKTMEECVQSISDAIDMETGLREDFSVVLYLPTAETAIKTQSARAAADVIAFEILSILQMEYDTFRLFWKKGKYPKLLHIIFGEYGDFKSHLTKVFREDNLELPQALWREVLGETEAAPRYKRKEIEALIEKTAEGPWPCLKALGLPDVLRESLPMMNFSSDREDAEIFDTVPGEQFMTMLAANVRALYERISLLNAGRNEEINEREASIAVERIRLEKQNDYHELIRNETLLFLYVYWRTLEPLKGIVFTAPDAAPATLIRKASALPMTNPFLASFEEKMRGKTENLLYNLTRLNPDKADRIDAKEHSEPVIEVEESVKWEHLFSSNTKGIAGDGAGEKKPDEGKYEKIKRTLLFRSVEPLYDEAVEICDRIEDSNRKAAETVREQTKRFEAAYREKKHITLEKIDKDTAEEERKTLRREDEEPRGSYLSSEKEKARTASRELIRKEFLDAEYRKEHGIVWQRDVFEQVDLTRRNIQFFYHRARWNRRIGLILAPVVFILAFLLPYLWLGKDYLFLIKGAPALAVTFGLAFFAYLGGALWLQMKYKQAIVRNLDRLLDTWKESIKSVQEGAAHFQELLLTHVPGLYSQTRRSEMMDRIRRESETRKSKITYHRRFIRRQMDVIQAVARDMDVRLPPARTSDDAVDSEWFDNAEPDVIQIDSSAVAEQNKEVYGITPREAGILLGYVKEEEAS